MFYAEYRNPTGGYTSATFPDYPQDRTADGQRIVYRLRVELPEHHRGLTLSELSVMYGPTDDQNLAVASG